MRAEMLHVVTCVANPMRWRSRIELFRRFAQHMLDSDVHLTVVECAYGERPFELAGMEHVHHVGVRAHTMVWNKECLINIGISRLPEGAKYIAWLDADIEFRRPSWAADTVHALQLYDVVQPWTDCYDLGPHDEHLEHHTSFACIWHRRQPIMQGPNAAGGPYRFAHPGYGWATTRRVLDAVGGLMDTAALGAADHHMAMALIGRVQDSVPRNLGASYSAPLLRWQERAARVVGGNLGAVPGTIEHAFHGAKDKRRYVDRWSILHQHRFCPETDLRRNSYGVIELCGNKPGLRHEIDRYFRQRDEDATTL